jgi:hypothetical protein
MADKHEDFGARRQWLPWRPRFRLILSYPRHWHYALTKLERFDGWFTRNYKGKRIWPFLLVVVFPVFVLVRFVALVAVLEITIIAFTVSIYLVWGEWLVLLLLFPFVLLSRNGARRWATRVTGWARTHEVIAAAHEALAAGREPPPTNWTASPRRSRIWM